MFVPGSNSADILLPPKYLRKAARAIWDEIWTKAAVESIARLRETDAAVVARYCVLRSQLEATLGKAPAATYETTSTTGARIVKANPAWSAMLQLQQQVTSLEHLLGLNPRARIDLLQRYADHRDPQQPIGGSPTSRLDDLPPGTPPKPASPIGLLVSHRRNPKDTH